MVITTNLYVLTKRMCFVLQDELSDEDSDDDFAPPEETALETYTTPLDDENCSIDEYVAFKEVLQSKYKADVLYRVLILCITLCVTIYLADER